MKVNRKSIILSIVVVFLSFIAFSGSVSETAYADDESNGSTIAGVNVKGLNNSEIKAALETAINQWSTQLIIVSGGGMQLEIDPTILAFDLEATIVQYELLTDKPWYAFWQSERVVQLPLVIASNEQIYEQISQIGIWDADETYNLLVTQASYLKEHEIEAKVLDLSQFENERLAFAIKTIPEKTQGISHIVGKINNTVINPGETFSYLETLGDDAQLANGEAHNFVASMLYSIVLETEYDIVERTQQSSIPTAVDPGFEASISLANYEDLKFMNSSEQVSKIKLSIEGNSLKAELYSSIKGASVSIRIDQASIAPRIVHRYSSKLPVGKQQVIQEGSKGLRVEVFRTISESGHATEQKVSRDYYSPTNRIVLVSSRQPAEGTATNDTEKTSTMGEQNDNIDDKKDKDLEIDLDGDGLPDTTIEKPIDEKELPKGSYYDKGGNLITP